jgi:hypothetical protein
LRIIQNPSIQNSDLLIVKAAGFKELNFALDRGQLQSPVALLPVKEPPVPINKGVGWVPEPVWTVWRKKFLPKLIEKKIVGSYNQMIKYNNIYV